MRALLVLTLSVALACASRSPSVAAAPVPVVMSPDTFVQRFYIQPGHAYIMQGWHVDTLTGVRSPARMEIFAIPCPNLQPQS